MHSHHPFTDRVIDLVAAIPPGRVATYGQLAQLAGNHRAARQVARILHACSRTHGLPWHRVVNRQGRISLGGEQADRQRELLRAEGVETTAHGRIDLGERLWRPDYCCGDSMPKNSS